MHEGVEQGIRLHLVRCQWGLGHTNWMTAIGQLLCGSIMKDGLFLFVGQLKDGLFNLKFLKENRCEGLNTMIGNGQPISSGYFLC